MFTLADDNTGLVYCVKDDNNKLGIPGQLPSLNSLVREAEDGTVILRIEN